MYPNKGYRAVYSLKFHLVLVTKDFCKIIDPEMLERLHAIMASICEKWECSLEQFSGDDNHVYLLINFSPEVQLSKFINNLKTVSSRLIRKEFQACIAPPCENSFWHGTYYITTCNGLSVEQLNQYVAQHDIPPTTQGLKTW
ncbi:MAG: IS200/IS605 family transposase [Pseudanabaena sp. CRU_2_10]|nr:IS200/IS605 family transposase [Pseudanabaena sp. CRU_2_10]